MIQSNLDKRMSMWEKYCLSHCFAVPEGFVLPKADEASSSGASLDLDALGDSELDMQLDSLREKLTQVGQECALLNREIQKVEKESALVTHSAASIDDALQLYEKHSSQEMFRELIEVASEFRMKTEKLKTPESSRMEKIELILAERTNMQNGELLQANIGIPNTKLEELQGLLDVMQT
ncbi:OLC1v1014031C1 [Oldenlandia corymbosa var. corymbosa]|nr:OLC1v1014031C1 [Oldenlandia corymbosa var. corymbosa]